MTNGVLNLPRTTLSAATVVAIEKRMVIGPTAGMIARRAGTALIKPKPTKLIPYIGWAIAIGSALYAGYEAYNSTSINWEKMEAEDYDANDMAVFRMGYTEAARVFALTPAGQAARRAGHKYILIPSEVMPMVAAVDAVGMGTYGNTLTWDPANKATRRYQAIGNLGRAGAIVYTNGNTVRGSWEEYPFASTLAPLPGAHVDRVPLRENWIQGGFIRAAAVVQRFRPSDTVLSFIL